MFLSHFETTTIHIQFKFLQGYNLNQSIFCVYTFNATTRAF